jgi:hypothetical protein
MERLRISKVIAGLEQAHRLHQHPSALRRITRDPMGLRPSGANAPGAVSRLYIGMVERIAHGPEHRLFEFARLTLVAARTRLRRQTFPSGGRNCCRGGRDPAAAARYLHSDVCAVSLRYLWIRPFQIE